MISDANMILEDAIIVLSLSIMFLKISKIGHEGPSTIGTHFCDLKAGMLI